MLKPLIHFLLILSLLVCCRPVTACNIPVFRYALENWPADAYEIVVFHRGALSAAHKAALASLEKAAYGPDNPTGANCEVSAVDLAGAPAQEMQEFWNEHAGAALPWVVLRYPGAEPKRTAWSGPLNAATARALVDSPARREIAKRIQRGDACVWVLLESNDGAQNAAAKAIENETKKTYEINSQPVEDAEGDDQLGVPGGDLVRAAVADAAPTRVAVSMIRLSRTDTSEQVLASMLLGSEPDLKPEHRAQPIAFPVFGRGRALCALVGKGIETANIQEAIGFLLGDCSCQIKDAAPGTDLLIAADWDKALTAAPTAMLQVAGSELPVPSSMLDNAKSAGAAGVPPAGDGASAESSGLLLNALLAAGAVAAIAAALALYVRRQSSRS